MALAWLHGALQHLRGGLQTTLPYTFGQKYGGDFRAALREAQGLAYVEMLGGFAVLVALNLLFFREDNWGYFDVNPHPFWLVVVPIAVRYGALPGYASGFLAAFLYLAFVVLQPRSVFAVDILSSQALLNPVLFLIGGGVLGEVREAHKRVHKELAARYDEVEAGLQDIAQRYLTAVEINREMQRRIVTQTATVTTLYQAAKALEDLEIEHLVPSLLELVTTFIEAESCAVYLREDGRFVLRAGRPEQVVPERPRELDVTRGVLALVVRERRTATVRDVIAEATPAEIRRQRLLMATPLLGENQEVIGIMTVEQMPFLRFTPTAVKLFALLGDWASTAFQRALRFQETRDRNIEDELTGAYSYSYMTKRLGEEYLRARLYRLPLTLLALQVEDYHAIAPVQLPRVLRTLGIVFRQHSRPFDILGKYATEDVFLLAVPHVGEAEARALGQRIQQEIQAFGFKPFDDERTLGMRVGVASLTEGVDSAQELVERAVRELAAPAPARPLSSEPLR
jgi:GGDEF domain-containing protein